ncbi:putative 5-hydroxyisourate hydrolase [Pseudolycoriella hygida]|uniref:5-hydroxyisourate hydrolase n=1 Tax=Pseudolycoriella hygida TaxID=35572 RepID=A0A9Q0NAM8_9DIPT|nr:putative 5-hydroxyisourate hydrolase [Pseudolycoriella hygida]
MDTVVNISLCFLICITYVAFGQNTGTKPLSVHVLDTTFGGNAPNMTCKLFKKRSSPLHNEKFDLIATAVTDSDGRINTFLSIENYQFGIYRLWFGVRDYYYSHGISTFYPQTQITFKNIDGSAYHIPLIISPYAV